MDSVRPDNWLNACARNVSSQFGEDGIIEKILEVLPHKDQWCVEFGAWDGKYLSNTCHLITSRGYWGVLIEGDRERFELLRRNFCTNPRVRGFNCLVGMTAADGLDPILRNTPIPLDFDLLSIDVDGNDYHCWDAVTQYKPKVVLIEFNPTIPDAVEFVQPRDPQKNWSSSLLSIVLLGKRKGYELVATTMANAIFVAAPYFPLFGIRDNSIAKLRHDRNEITYIFHGQDGTILMSGKQALHWHGLPMREAVFQVLPPALRKYPDNYNESERLLFTIYKELYSHVSQRDPAAAARMPSLGAIPASAALEAAELQLWRAMGSVLAQRVERPAGQ